MSRVTLLPLSSDRDCGVFLSALGTSAFRTVKRNIMYYLAFLRSLNAADSACTQQTKEQNTRKKQIRKGAGGELASCVGRGEIKPFLWEFTVERGQWRLKPTVHQMQTAANQQLTSRAKAGHCRSHRIWFKNVYHRKMRIMSSLKSDRKWKSVRVKGSEMTECRAELLKWLLRNFYGK